MELPEGTARRMDPSGSYGSQVSGDLFVGQDPVCLHASTWGQYFARLQKSAFAVSGRLLLVWFFFTIWPGFPPSNYEMKGFVGGSMMC